jgi:hypothetical protein
LALLDDDNNNNTPNFNEELIEDYIPLSFEAMKQHDKRYNINNSKNGTLSPLDSSSKKPTPRPQSLLQSRKNTSHAEDSSLGM